MLENFPKPPKDNQKQRGQVRVNEKGNRAYKNRENNDDHKIYASMAKFSSNNAKVKNMVTVHNRPIGYQIPEQRAT